MTTEAIQPGEVDAQDLAVTGGAVSAQPQTPFDQLMERRGIAKPDAVGLVVDDLAMLRNLNSRVISRLGVQPKTADDGDTGLEAIRELHGRLGVLVTDVNMERMDGTEMIKLADAERLLRDVPIVIVSGNMDENAEAVAKATEGRVAAEILPKPFTPDELIAAIQRASQKVLDKMGKL